MEESLARMAVDSKKYGHKFIKNVFDNIAENYNIENVDLVISDTSDCVAAYYPIKINGKSGYIEYNYELIIKRCLSRIKKYYEGDFNENHFIPLYIITVFLHEFEHARQEIVLRHNKDIEGLILSDSINGLDNLYKKYTGDNYNILKLYFGSKRFEKISNKLYSYNPEERLAYIKSTEIAAKVASLVSTKDYFVFKKSFLQKLKYGYSQNEDERGMFASPTKRYLDEISNNNHWKDIELMSDNLFFIERFLYGLDVSREEMETLNKILKVNSLQLKLIR